MARVRCANEDLELQRLLQQNFSLLPGDQISPEDPRRWMCIQREMPVPDPAGGGDRWSVDFLLVDQDGVPTFVECKRYADTRSRREVIGQMVEYAANGHHYWSAGQLQSLAEKTASDDKTTLAQAVEALSPSEREEPDAFFERVEQNLRSGRLRLVFFMEEAPYELRSAVEFLNGQMELTEVLLIEAQQFTDGSVRVVVPRVFGYTEQARMVKRAVTVGAAGPRRRWDEGKYFDHAANLLTEGQLRALHAFYDGVVRLGYEIGWGTGRENGSINIKDPTLAQKSLLSVYTNGLLETHAGWLDLSDSERRVGSRLREVLKPILGERAANESLQHVQFGIDDWWSKVDDVLRALDEVRCSPEAPRT